ncbi:hypothetical protein AGR4B_pAt20349 [Agrobacterium tumefaciens str. CFBP 5621]|nr:hypothetical protein AGR4B_pAt20349 [Agrobacterium tumefaciens str. CFBP 5621]
MHGPTVVKRLSTLWRRAGAVAAQALTVLFVGRQSERLKPDGNSLVIIRDEEVSFSKTTRIKLQRTLTSVESIREIDRVRK